MNERDARFFHSINPPFHQSILQWAKPAKKNNFFKMILPVMILPLLSLEQGSL
jgi:hypothetical protein